MQNEIIIFDFDGTIADTAPRFMEIANILSKKHGFSNLYSLDLEEMRNHTMWDLIFKYFKIPLYKLPFIIFDFKKLLCQTALDTKLFPEIKDILFRLRDKGYRLGLVTSSPYKVVIPVLEKYGLRNIFEFQKTSASMYHKEKNLRSIILDHKLNKENLYYIGDEIRDLEACKKLQVHCISVSWGFSSKNLLLTRNPEIVIDTPMQILDYFEKIQ